MRPHAGGAIVTHQELDLIQTAVEDAIEFAKISYESDRYPGRHEDAQPDEVKQFSLAAEVFAGLLLELKRLRQLSAKPKGPRNKKEQ